MENTAWWKKGIIYQIYPRSYQDTSNNGVGDLKGILSRLDYIKSLGIECIWLSPIYPSPMHDFGYDVANYIDIEPLFGNLEDFEALLNGIHEREMKLMLDFVPNHTSTEHEWFKEAKKGKNNPYRDYYIWRDPKPDGSMPNNWTSYFGGSGWEYDVTSGQYYYHQFEVHQPELNYENPKVIKSMKSFMKFWLDKGVDGFRLDVIFHMKKDPRFLDEPINTNWNGVRPWEETLKIYTGDVEGIHDLVQEYRDLLDEYENRVFLGEIYLPISKLVKYYNEIQLPSNTILLTVPWNSRLLKPQIKEYFDALPEDAWPNWQLGNHDNHRLISRVGRAQAKVAAMFLLTIKGTPIIYYGEEIGMENGVIPLDKIQDPPAVNEPEHADEIGRDPERTPMQWDNSPNAGFCLSNIEPWLPVAENYLEFNVKNQVGIKDSMLSFYQELIKIRQEHTSLHVGDYEEVSLPYEELIVYKRFYPNHTSFLVILNLGTQYYTLDLSEILSGQSFEILLSTTNITQVLQPDHFQVDANQGLLIKL